MNHLYLLFLFVFMLSACHSHKETCTQAAYVQEVARSDITNSDVDAYLSKLINRDIVITLEDVVVQYHGEYTAKVSDNRPPDIRSHVAPARLTIGQVRISDKSEESTNLRVEGNTIQASDFHSNEAADLKQHVKQESAQLHPLQGHIFMISLCILLFAVVLVILYRKGKLRLLISDILSPFFSLHRSFTVMWAIFYFGRLPAGRAFVYRACCLDPAGFNP